MDIKKHMEAAWGITLKFVVPLILMTLVMAVVSAVTLGILAPVTMAGYMHSILLMVRQGREPKVQDLFSHMGLFFPLLIFTILLVIAVMVGFALLVLPGIAIICLVSFACLYMLPLMTDRKLGLIDAIKESWRLSTAQGKVADQIVVVILFLVISAVGNAVFIGFLFTQPLATAFLLSVYEEKIGAPAAPPAPPPAV